MEHVSDLIKIIKVDQSQKFYAIVTTPNWHVMLGLGLGLARVGGNHGSMHNTIFYGLLLSLQPSRATFGKWVKNSKLGKFLNICNEIGKILKVGQDFEMGSDLIDQCQNFTF